MKNQRLLIGLIFCFSVSFLSHPAEVPAQADPFYKGKTIRIIVGSTPGGFYDRWARLFARYMAKYIPGQPEIIAQNMPGAGSVIATNHVFGVAKPDGLTEQRLRRSTCRAQRGAVRSAEVSMDRLSRG